MKKLILFISLFITVTVNAQTGSFSTIKVNSKLQLKTRTITDFTTGFMNSDSLSDAKIPTAKAVADYVRSHGGGGGGAVSSVFGRTEAVVAASGDYSAYYPLLSGYYNNPSWINQLAYSKITGVPSFITNIPTDSSSLINNRSVYIQKQLDSIGNFDIDIVYDSLARRDATDNVKLKSIGFGSSSTIVASKVITDTTAFYTFSVIDGSITNAKAATMPSNTIKVNNTGSTAAPIDGTVSQVKTMLSLDNVSNTSDATKNSATATLTNKTIAFGSNTVTTTLAQLNTAVTDADLVSLAMFNGHHSATTDYTVTANDYFVDLKEDFIEPGFTKVLTLGTASSYTGKKLIVRNYSNGMIWQFSPTVKDSKTNQTITSIPVYSELVSDGTDWIINRDSVGTGSGGVSDGDKGDITISASGATYTIDANAVTTSKVADANITKAKIENVAVGNVLGRSSTTAGAPQEVGVPIVLSTGSASSVASLDLDLSNWYTVYDVITIEFYGVRPATDGAIARIRVSSDGTTYASGASNYKYAFKYVTGAGAEGVDGTADTYIAASGTGTGVDNASTSDYNATIKIANPNVSSVYPVLKVDAGFFNSAGEYFWFSGGGSRQAAQVCRGIQLSFSTGNISAVKYKIIGIKNN